MVEIIYGVSVTNHPFSSSYRQEEKPDKAVSKKENSRFIRERSVTMKPKNERPFYKVIAVLLAVTMMSAGLTAAIGLNLGRRNRSRPSNWKHQNRMKRTRVRTF